MAGAEVSNKSDLLKVLRNRSLRALREYSFINWWVHLPCLVCPSVTNYLEVYWYLHDFLRL